MAIFSMNFVLRAVFDEFLPEFVRKNLFEPNNKVLVLLVVDFIKSFPKSIK